MSKRRSWPSITASQSIYQLINGKFLLSSVELKRSIYFLYRWIHLSSTDAFNLFHSVGLPSSGIVLEIVMQGRDHERTERIIFWQSNLLCEFVNSIFLLLFCFLLFFIHFQGGNRSMWRKSKYLCDLEICVGVCKCSITSNNH